MPEDESPVLVVTGVGSPEGDTGAPMTVTEPPSPAGELVPSAGEAGNDDPGVLPLSGVAGGEPPVMTVTEPSDWPQPALPPSDTAASSSKAAMTGLYAPATSPARTLVPMSPIVPLDHPH